MPTLVNLTFNIADLVGSDFDPRRTKVWLEANVDTIIDTTGKQIRLGDVKATVGDDGTGSFVGLIATNSTDVNPTGFLYRAQIDYQPRSGGPRVVWSSGWFALTASSDLALVTPVANAPATVTEDAVIASRAKDPGSATNAAIDEAVAGDVNDTASQTRGALNATFAPTKTGPRAIPRVKQNLRPTLAIDEQYPKPEAGLSHKVLWGGNGRWYAWGHDSTLRLDRKSVV